jgi:hypothetical protein
LNIVVLLPHILALYSDSVLFSLCYPVSSTSKFKVIPSFQIISCFDFFGTSILLCRQIHSKVDVPKKSKRLIVWTGGSIQEFDNPYVLVWIVNFLAQSKGIQPYIETSSSVMPWH